MTARPVSQLLTGGRPPDHPIAMRAGAMLDCATLTRHVGQTRAALPEAPALALACLDTYAFVVGLLALLHAARDVVLPANLQPGTLSALPVPVMDDAWINGVLTRDDRGAAALPLPPIAPERSAITLYTSGSTGTPKAIRKSIGMLEREGAMLHGVWSAAAGAGPVHATVSHQHLYGLAFKVMWPLTAGIPFAAETHEVWETLLPRLTAGCVVIASPAHLSRLGGLAPVPASQRPRLIFTAGAPLSPEAAAATQAVFGAAPEEIFGSSETGAVATRRQDGSGDIWRLLPGSRMRTDAQGTLSLFSSHADGWHATADIVEPMDGGFRFLGRADDVLKIEGQRVSLTQIEQALLALPWIAAAAVLRRPDADDRLAAAVVLNPEGQAMLTRDGAFRCGRRLRQALTATLAPAVVPRQWRFIDRLPERALGKRDTAALAALFRPGS